MKKLAIISPSIFPIPAVRGGAIEQLVTYIVEGNEENHQYDIDLYTMDDPALDEFNYKYTNLVRIRVQNKRHPVRLACAVAVRLSRIFKETTRYNYISYEMYRNFKKDYYDEVLVENNMDTFSLMLKKRTKEKFFFHLHNDFDPDQLSDETKTKAKTQIVIQNADKILVVSKFLKDKLIRYGAKESSISVVYNSIDRSKLVKIDSSQKRVLRNKFGISQNDVVFTYVGRLVEYKGLDKLLEATKNLKSTKNIKCLIIGNNFFETKKDDEYIQKLKNIAVEIKNQVIFTGYVNNSDINRIYSISDYVVVPSQCEEAFGVVALEAITMGVPVIASRSGGLTEVLNPKCATLINRDSEFLANLTSAIKRDYLNTKQEYSDMSKEASRQSKEFPQTKSEYYRQVLKAFT
jgi:glycosyltransferase involved in cell wall biosynthesis